MKMVNTIYFFSLAAILFLVALNAEAADQSICNPDNSISLHESGTLRSCRLSDDYTINGITCKGDAPIHFYANGNLESCVLSDDTTISGDKCKGDAPANFYSDGRLRSCIYPE